jgi:hypothetical protein
VPQFFTLERFHTKFTPKAGFPKAKEIKKISSTGALKE